jgi:hypothetical protein
MAPVGWPRLEKRFLTSFEGRVGYIDERGNFELKLADGGAVTLYAYDPSLTIIPLDIVPSEKAKRKRKRDE